MDGMIPRIAVPDKDDRATIIAALIQYAHAVTARGMVTGDFSHLIHELKISVELMEELRDSFTKEAVDRLMPTETEWEKFQDGFGNDPGH